jgi:hypothetical protein
MAATSSPTAREHAWTLGLHQEDRKGVAKLIAPLELAEEGWAMELGGGQQRSEGLEEEIIDFGSPRENQGGGELLSEEGKQEK